MADEDFLESLIAYFEKATEEDIQEDIALLQELAFGPIADGTLPIDE